MFATPEMRKRILAKLAAEKKAKADKQARIDRASISELKKPISDNTYVKKFEPKKFAVAEKKSTYKPTREDMEYSKRMNIPIEDIIEQGGVTPAALAKEIQSKRSYDVKYGPGLYKKAKKR